MANRNKKVAQQYSENKKSGRFGNSKNKNKSADKASKYQKQKAAEPRPDDPNQVQKHDVDAMNDIGWYAANEQLLKDTASIPFAWATGLSTDSNSKHVPETIPGICALAIDLNPMSIGGASDPINVAARQITADIRVKNSGGKAYDPADLMLFMLAEGEFISFLVHATRIYATASMYNAYNRYMPDGIFDVMNINGQNIRDNLANFRAALNVIIAKAASIVYLPEDIPLFKRWRWLYANYYQDSDNPKDQIYFLHPRGYRVFEVDEETSMGMLKYYVWNNTDRESQEVIDAPKTWTDIIDALNAMLTPLIEDQDLCLINGDMMKVYGNNVIPFSLIPELLIALPVHNHDVLEQFRNATTMMEMPSDTQANTNDDIIMSSDGTLLAAGDYQLYDQDQAFRIQSTDYSLGSTYWTNLNETYGCELLMDSSNPAPTPVDVMENSRLMCRIVDTSVDEHMYVNFTTGSEKVRFITFARRHKVNRYTYQTVLNIVKSQIYIFNSLSMYNRWNYLHGFGMEEGMAFLAFIKMFDYCPKFSVTHVQTKNGELTYSPVGLTTRINNFALIPVNMLRKMNDCALLSEMHVLG